MNNDETKRIESAYTHILPSTRQEMSLLKEAVKTHNIKLDYVLDVGCGVGHTIEILVKLGARGFGLDLNQNVILWLKRKMGGYNFEFINQDFINFTTSRPLSLITMLAVLEHIKDDRAFLEKAFNLLNEDGYLIMVVPAHSKQFCRHDRQYGHFRRYDKLTLTTKLQSCGFEVIEIYSYGFQLLQSINSMFIKNNDIQDARRSTIKSSFELPNWYVKLYPILKFGLYPYNLLQKPFKNTDWGNAYFVISRKPFKQKTFNVRS